MKIVPVFNFGKAFMKQLIISALIATCPVAALAETQLERLEAISEKMNDAMFDAMVRMVEQQGGDPEPLRSAIPDGTWDSAYRTAGACMLDRYVEASSQSAVDTMLDDMEDFIPKMAEMDLENMSEETDFLPEGISEDFSISVNMECGLTDIMLDRMEKSGFMAAMMAAMGGN